MKSRKTIEVRTIISMTNEYLKTSPNESQCIGVKQWCDLRYGACHLLESILFETGNYQGYNYLPDNAGDVTRRFYY